jgi:hypothetical protein
MQSVIGTDCVDSSCQANMSRIAGHTENQRLLPLHLNAFPFNGNE